MLRARPKEELLVEITEAMTTNESSFFRDIKPYEHLRNSILPMQMAKRITGAKADAHLERRLLHRPGAVFHRHVPAGRYGHACRLEV